VHAKVIEMIPSFTEKISKHSLTLW